MTGISSHLIKMRLYLLHGQNTIYELLSYFFPGAWTELGIRRWMAWLTFCSLLSHLCMLFLLLFFLMKSVIFLSVKNIMKMCFGNIYLSLQAAWSHSLGYVRNCLSNVQIWCLAPIISVMPSWVAALPIGVWCGKRMNIWQQTLFCPCYFFPIDMNWKLLVLIGVLGLSGTPGRNLPAQRAV